MMGKKNMNISDCIFKIVIFVICIFSFVVVVYPLYFVVIASFSDSTLVGQGKVLFTIKGFSLYGYKKILEDGRIWIGYRNTHFYALAGTLINLAVTMPAAYGLSRRDFAPRRLLMLVFVFTMYFSGGIIPAYILVQKLNMLNTAWAMMIPCALSVYNLIIARSFIETLPPDLYEAAQLDGCSHFRYFLSVVLPLSKAIISVLFLYYMVGHWNDFFSALLYIYKDEMKPLQIILRDILISNQAFAEGVGMGSKDLGSSYAQKYADQVKFGVIIVSTLPVLCIYPFIQKYFEKGVMIGAIKG